MGGLGHQRLSKRPGLMILALAALWIQALVPAGYMIAPDRSPGLVICTGHGPLVSHDHPGGGPAADHQGACVFAGHGLAISPPLPTRLPAQVIQAQPPAIVVAVAQSPGLGLAAPPPPSHAPPALT